MATSAYSPGFFPRQSKVDLANCSSSIPGTPLFPDFLIDLLFRAAEDFLELFFPLKFFFFEKLFDLFLLCSLAAPLVFARRLTPLLVVPNSLFCAEANNLGCL